MLISHISSFSNLLFRLLVVLFFKNCLYNIFPVILYTTTILATVLTTDSGYKIQ